MPRKVHPRYGWRRPNFRPGVPDDDLKARYPDAFFDQIVRDFKLPSELLPKLRSCVLHAGAIYAQFKMLKEGNPHAAECVASLLDLKEDIERISKKWEVLDDMSWNHFWRAEQGVQEECVWGNSSAMREIGAMWDISKEEVGFYTHYDFPPVIRLMVMILDRAAADVARPRRGRRRQDPIRYWAKAILDFWEKDLGKRVTYEHFGGESITETHRFLEALLRPLDASATRQLGTVLEEERTARKRG